MSKVKIQGNASGTGTFTIQAPNSNTDRVLSLPDNAGEILTDASDISQQANTNQVLMVADMSADQSVSSSTWTKVAFDTALVDSHNWYNTSTYRYTPQIAGWYSVSATIGFPNGVTRYLCAFQVGTNTYGDNRVFDLLGNSSGAARNSGTRIVYLNGSTDYLETYGWLTSTGTHAFTQADGVMFSAHLVRAD